MFATLLLQHQFCHHHLKPSGTLTPEHFSVWLSTTKNNHADLHFQSPDAAWILPPKYVTMFLAVWRKRVLGWQRTHFAFLKCLDY